MLHRSFKPAKCKTSLKLAVSRIKLLKNKREAQVRQLKRELAQLLEAGQDQTARIRVEHVVREEKTLAAYDLLEIYCELLVARLPIIESQKNCPIDLKEAISSVIFASPRCADLPELMDARKHFTAKYGKEFASAAVELRPDCGVSRMLVEKLSANAPDGPTKIKILSAIADEHNIKWEPKSFGEKDSKPPEDLLNGPNTFGKASQMLVDPPNVQSPSNFYDKGPPHGQVPPKYNEMHDVPVNLNEHHARSAQYSQTSAATDVGVNKTMSSGTYHPEVRYSGSGNEGMEMEFMQSHTGGGNSSLGGQSWNMGFKDATAAAQAAAESAERASLAARAAAELSSRENFNRQYSTDTQKSSAYGLRDDQSQKYAGPTLESDPPAKVPIDNTLHGINSKMQYDHLSDDQENPVTLAEKNYRDGLNSTVISSHSASLKSTTGDVSPKNQYNESDVYFVKEVRDVRNSMNVDHFEAVRMENPFSLASSRSHSSTFVYDHDVVLSVISDKNDEPFVVDERSVQRNKEETSSHESASAFFDDSDSDDDEYKFNIGGVHKEQEYGFEYSTSDKLSLFANTDPWRPSKNTDYLEKKSSSQSHYSTVFSENQTSSEVLSQLDDPLPVMFDDSDGSSSDIEEDKSKLVGSNDHGTFPREQIVHSENSDQVHVESHEVIECSFSEKGEGRSSKLLSRPSSVYSNAVEVHNDRNQKVEVGAESERKFNYCDKTTTKSSSGIRKSQNDKRDSFSDPPDEGNYQKSRFSMVHEVKDDAFVLELADTMKDTEVLTESTVESGKELKFGPLTGGLRNKGYWLPPYRKSSPGNASGSKQAAEDTLWKVELSSQTVKGSVSTGAHSQEPHNQKVSAEANKKTSTRSTVTYHESSDVDSGDELPQQTSSSSGESYNRKAVAEESKISSSRASVTCIDSEKSDFEDDFPKQTLTCDARPNARFSHRTKPSAPNSRRSLYPKTTVLSEMHPKPLSENKSSDHWRSSGQPRLQEQTASETVSESKRSLREESLKASARGQAVSESKRSSREESLKSSAREPPIHLPKIVTSGSTETSKSSSSSSESPSGEKPSHVHPKLPDYDSITEHLQSLRKNQP
ncbi:Ist1 domain-containing protein [Cephalotus follicularis]|uniref:Ist1 domain-containing protein n=1 Tax=Cephalotus follicularis TaxID=3775 RepID=A0A1Q3B2K2_CEPFO|nr:Ist1 domain-containing protein [Cephalotus follicularis]